MKINYKFRKNISSFFFLLIFLIVLMFQNKSQVFQALSMENIQTSFITEELRLTVPADLKETWLEAEKNIWEPWLSSQNGFLGRQIFWDKENEEALILVKWKNRDFWKNISIKEVNKIQERFEKEVQSSLNLSSNPFKLIYEGELHEQV